MKVVLISTDESRVGMGVRTLSSCLIEIGIKPIIIFMAALSDTYEGFRWDDLFELCRNADLIGISAMTHSIAKAVVIKERITERQSTPIIIGGIHASIFPESLVYDFNYVCYGEGEDVIVEACDCIGHGKPLNDIPGLWVRNGDEFIKNPPFPLKKSLIEYPFPDYDLEHQYVLDGCCLTKMRPIALHMSIDDFVVLGSRGCPHNCTYCCNKKIKENFVWRKKVQHYTIDYLMENLNVVKQTFPEVRSIWIEDDTFFAKKIEEIIEFSSRYKKEIGLPFKILISPWTYSREKLDPLVEAGMSSLMMGIQSGCERVNLDLYSRKMRNERLKEIIGSLNTYSDLLKCYDFIGMNPFETLDDLLETLWFIKAIPRPFFMFFNNLAFYPGTDLYVKAKELDIDTSRRIKHSESQIGFEIIMFEQMNHKLFHLLFLLMAGKASKLSYGKIPAFMLTKTAINIFYLLDKSFPRYCDMFAVLLAKGLYCLNWKRIVKKTFKPSTISKIRHFLTDRNPK